MQSNVGFAIAPLAHWRRDSARSGEPVCGRRSVSASAGPQDGVDSIGGFMPQDFLDIHKAVKNQVSDEASSGSPRAQDFDPEPIARSAAPQPPLPGQSAPATGSTGGYSQDPALEELTGEPRPLAELRQQTLVELPYNEAVMLPPHSQVAFMQLLVQTIRATRIVEVGTFTGYSALAMAMALDEASEGKVTTVDIRDDYLAMARRAWSAAQVESKIDFVLGDGISELEAIDTDSVDLVFIDADKARYPEYVEEAIRIVRRGGLVLLDDALWSGRIFEEHEQDPATTGIRTAVRQMLNDNRIKASMVPVGDGLVVGLVL